MEENRGMKIRLIGKTDAEPIALASHAALKCYQSQSPKMGKTIRVKDRLFDVGHHTTMQHTFFTFDVEGISIGDITAGLHLVSPFYNTDQRSGRYCATMFTNPDFDQIADYILTFWPTVDFETVSSVISYIKSGVSIYQENLDQAVEITRRFLSEDRPYLKEKSLDASAPKIAQEQLRMFISAIFPTGLDFTVNSTALAAMYRSAWTPAMKVATNQMARIVMDEFPQLSFMFDLESRREREWSFDFREGEQMILNSPKLTLWETGDERNFVMPKLEDMHPVDLLHFMPEYMDNSVEDIETAVEISLATMGQDQRHRTIRRGNPEFTGNFYLPAVLQECGLFQEAQKILHQWKSLRGKIPETLLMVIAPYGAMVSYKKRGNYNAVAHEQIKRLCWCAQEEISEIGRLMRAEIKKKNPDSPLLQIFQPPCYETGKCVEGGRYCGRDINNRTPETYFPKRRV